MLKMVFKWLNLTNMLLGDLGHFLQVSDPFYTANSHVWILNTDLYSDFPIHVTCCWVSPLCFVDILKLTHSSAIHHLLPPPPHFKSADSSVFLFSEKGTITRLFPQSQNWGIIIFSFCPSKATANQCSDPVHFTFQIHQPSLKHHIIFCSHCFHAVTPFFFVSPSPLPQSNNL